MKRAPIRLISDQDFLISFSPLFPFLEKQKHTDFTVQDLKNG